ncbi:type IV secretory system conjugative DNA transfer family protein [Sphingomonas sp. CARO-RG-8B-R24-01]|uniref:type IV secretory system conjugative DNA transfer family protein n=1 Tax=Sphingomonas sp. CARO-RG-8B-R24-01 TaxID=2914831 RepID=UPI001F59FCD0|nr:type IV secretory system conjugative DNA transfer family protein [Sphingomonas sp. CARO-RG-8B-R24-01]
MSPVWFRYNRQLQVGVWFTVIIFATVVAATIGVFGALAWNRMISPGIHWAAAPFVVWRALGQPWMARPFWLAFGVGLFATLVAGIALRRQREGLYGNARFRTNQEIRKAGLRSGHGPIIGWAAGGLLRAPMEMNIYMAAPTRTGKGVGFVIPNLLDFTGSTVVLDMKREAYKATSGWRRTVLGQKVFLFDPLSSTGETHCFNPLGYIDRDDAIGVVSELQRMSLQWLPYPISGNPFFTDAARNGFVGVGAYLAANPDFDFTIANIFRILTNDPQNRLGQVLEQIEKDPSANIAAGAVELLRSFISIPTETFGSVKSTIESKLGLFANPKIVMATRRSDFDLRQLRTLPMSIFMGSDPGDMTLLAPLYNVIFQQIGDLHTRELPPRPLDKRERARKARDIQRGAAGGEDKKAAEIRAAIVRQTGFVPGQRNVVPVILIVDEFKRLGKMDVLGEGFSYLAGYGVRIAAVFQSPAQIVAVYGPHMAREIEANCGIQIFYTPNTFADAKDISERLGTQTVKTRTRSDSRTALFQSSSGNLGNISHSEASRPLLMPQEVEDMPQRMGLIFQPGAGRPILHQRIRYFENRTFRARAARGWVVPPVQSMDDYQRYVRRQGCRVLDEKDLASVPLERIVIDPQTAAAFASIIADAKAPAPAARSDEAAKTAAGDGGVIAQGEVPAPTKRPSRYSKSIEDAKQRAA